MTFQEFPGLFLLIKYETAQSFIEVFQTAI